MHRGLLKLAVARDVERDGEGGRGAGARARRGRGDRDACRRRAARQAEGPGVARHEDRRQPGEDQESQGEERQEEPHGAHIASGAALMDFATLLSGGVVSEPRRLVRQALY